MACYAPGVTKPSGARSYACGHWVTRRQLRDVSSWLQARIVGEGDAPEASFPKGNVSGRRFNPAEASVLPGALAQPA